MLSKLLFSLSVCVLLFCGCRQAPKPAPNPTTLRVFTATWCAACKQDEPRLARLQSQGVIIERIDVDEQPDLAGQFGVVTIPAYFILDPVSGTWKRTRIK